MIEKLKVGDKVYRSVKERWGNNIYYSFEEVVRLTKTQAVLNDGTKLINEPSKGWGTEYGFPTYGDHYAKWFITTDKAIKEAAIENERQSIDRWFGKRKFTDSEKAIIFKHFKELGMSENKPF